MGSLTAGPALAQTQADLRSCNSNPLSTEFDPNDPFLYQAGKHYVYFLGYEYVSRADSCATNFYYCVTSGDRPAISHLTFGDLIAGGCFNDTDKFLAGTWTYSGSGITTLPGGGARSYTNRDPKTGLSGVKFDTGFQEGETKYFYLSVPGKHPDPVLHESTITLAIKDGNCQGDGCARLEVPGPGGIEGYDACGFNCLPDCGDCLISGPDSGCPGSTFTLTAEAPLFCTHPNLTWTVTGDVASFVTNGDAITVTAGSSCGNIFVEAKYDCIGCNGDPISCTHEILLEDSEAPVLAGVPANTTATCISIPPVATVTATDLCTASPVVTFRETTIPGACHGRYTLLRTWTATDACGNEASGSQTIEVIDESAPVLRNVPTDVSLTCGQLLPMIPAVFATDLCDASPVVSMKEETIDGNCAGNYQVIRTWTATDACGNRSSASQTITYQDRMAPVLIGVPGTLILTCDQPVPAPAEVTAVDVCDSQPQVSFSERTIPGACEGTFTIIRTWTAADVCGNQTEATQTIQVLDTRGPLLADVPADVILGCEAPIPGVAIVTASDACDNDPHVAFSEQVIPGSCDGMYTILRTWTATDQCGNQTSASQRIRVEDNTAPVITGVPADLTLGCDQAATAPATVSVQDRCDDSPLLSFSETTVPGTCGGEFTVLRTWTAIDACGNISREQQRISFKDNQAPSLQGTPANAQISCGDILPPAPSVTATDLCDPNPEVRFIEKTIPGSVVGEYTIERAWTATDACGNTTSYTQVITVVNDDQTPPMILDVPGDVIVSCDEIPSMPSVSVSDNSSLAPEIVYEETVVNGPCAGTYTIVRTWTATDACGNQAKASQTIEVVDDKGPELFGVPADRVIECRQAIPKAPFVYAIDNCDPSTSIQFAQTTIDGACAGEYVVERTWTATDGCGNQTTDTQKIRIVDTKAPVLLNPPGNLILSCDEPVPAPAAVVAFDPCDPDPQVKFTETTFPGDCPGSAEIQRTWTTTDACGNIGTYSQTIRILDRQAPQLIGVPEDLKLTCGDIIPAAPLLAATDNCDANPSVQFSEETIAGNCGSSFSIIRTWLATDFCGNQRSASQTIRVTDNTAPVLLGVPANLVLSCNEVIPSAKTVTASDQCDPNPDIRFTEQILEGQCAGEMTIIRRWTAMDACGNSSTSRQTILVRDQEAPQLEAAPADLTLACSEDIPEPVSMIATDNCDPDVSVTLNERIQPGSCAGSFTILRTWIATDDCGNSSEASQMIRVEDRTAPEFVQAPGDLLFCFGEDILIPLPEVLDGCDPNPQTSIVRNDGLPLEAEFEVGTTILTVSATDACGNVATVSFTVTVSPPLSCLITAPDNIVCGSGGFTYDLWAHADAGGQAGSTYSYAWTLAGNGWTTAGATNERLLSIHAGSGEATASVVVTDEQGCISECSLPIGCEEQDDTYCTLTQGYYGNPTGKQNGQTTIGLIEAALAKDLNGDGEDDPLVLGLPGRSVTFASGSGDCIIARLPGNGKSSALPAGLGDLVMEGPACEAGLLTTDREGRFENNLLTQTIALSLNLRLDPGLALLSLRDLECIGMPSRIADQLGEDARVYDLVKCANEILGGNNACGLPAGEATGAIGVIQDVFTECRRLPSGCNTFESSAQPDETNAALLEVYPNPAADGLVTLEAKMEVESETAVLIITNDMGQVLFEKDLYPSAGDTSAIVDVTNWPEGLYHVELRHVNGSIRRKLAIE